MNSLYLTADQVGIPTGGGLVTHHESEALKELGLCDLIDRRWLQGTLKSVEEPWYWDNTAAEFVEHWTMFRSGLAFPSLCHVYSGTWGKTVAALQRNGCKVAVTVAAHDRHVSRRGHEELGLDFPYPHLTEEPLWQRYIEGYRLADVIVCPGEVAARTVRGYGPEFKNKQIRVIPHGCVIPEVTKPIPKTFTVGYLGSFGADKGVRYLLEAWKKLNYRDAVLMLGGRDSTSPWAYHLISTYGGGDVILSGWVKNVSDFYNACSLYVQPSATEGFGIEVCEAMAHGRPVICSGGAGAVDLVMGEHFGMPVPACNAAALAAAINTAKTSWDLVHKGTLARRAAERYTWAGIRGQYQELWKEMLGD